MMPYCTNRKRASGKSMDQRTSRSRSESIGLCKKINQYNRAYGGKSGGRSSNYSEVRAIECFLCGVVSSIDGSRVSNIHIKVSLPLNRFAMAMGIG